MTYLNAFENNSINKYIYIDKSYVSPSMSSTRSCRFWWVLLRYLTIIYVTTRIYQLTHTGTIRDSSTALTDANKTALYVLSMRRSPCVDEERIQSCTKMTCYKTITKPPYKPVWSRSSSLSKLQVLHKWRTSKALHLLMKQCCYNTCLWTSSSTSRQSLNE